MDLKRAEQLRVAHQNSVIEVNAFQKMVPEVDMEPIAALALVSAKIGEEYSSTPEKQEVDVTCKVLTERLMHNPLPDPFEGVSVLGYLKIVIRGNEEKYKREKKWDHALSLLDRPVSQQELVDAELADRISTAA